MYGTMNDKHNEKTAKEWRDSAAYWMRHESTVRTMFTPLTDALLEAAELKAGHRVLDVAGGPGEPSLRIAEAVGPAGRVVHTDFALEMVLSARGEAGERGLANLDHVLMAGQSIAFADRTFDRVSCRLGFMFMPEPLGTAAEMLRVTRPGGRIVLVVWGTREDNPYFRIPADVVARYVPAPPDPPDAATAWRYAEPGKLVGLFERAGAASVAEREFDFVMTSGLDFEAFWTARQELSGSLREKLGTLHAAGRERITKETREAMAPFFATGVMRIPARALAVTVVAG